jgi:hypothetical protein
VFLVSIAAFALGAFSQTRRTAPLVVVGVAIGALTMTKVNTGGLLAVAVVFGLVVGSRGVPRWLRIVVATLAAIAPVVLLSQRIFETWVGVLAVLVIGAIAALIVSMSIDLLPLTLRPLLPIALGAAAAILVSFSFPVLTGTPLTDEVHGVLVRPLTFANSFTIPATIHFDWLTFVFAAAAISAAVVFRSMSTDAVRANSSWTHAALAALAVWVLGLGVMFWQDWETATWLPGLVALPALAYCCATTESSRLALRLLVPVAVLQILLVYPVAGSQVVWGTVALVVPCAIALALGVDRSRVWRDAGRLRRGAAAGALCIALVVVSGPSSASPLGLWKGYVKGDALGLPGAGMIRVDPDVESTSFGVLGAIPLPNLVPNIREVVRALRANCDTFYGVPNLNSFYVWSGLPPMTGMLANGGPDGLTSSQQQQIIDAFRAREAAHERVCVLRDGTLNELEPGPLADLLNQYRKAVATVENYSISTRF